MSWVLRDMSLWRFEGVLRKWQGGCELVPASGASLSPCSLHPLQILRHFSFQKSQRRKKLPPVKAVPTQPPGPPER